MALERKPRNQNLTIPNALSLLRIVVVPFFAMAFLNGDLLTAAILLAVSGLSDLFDGMIARKFNQITELGKMLDPLADKLTQGVVALCLAVKFPVIRPVLVIFICKELGMLCCATVMFYISVGVIVLMDGAFQLSGPVFSGVSYGLLLLTAFMMIYSGIRYFQIFLEILHSSDEKYELNLPDEIRTKTVREPRKK